MGSLESKELDSSSMTSTTTTCSTSSGVSGYCRPLILRFYAVSEGFTGDVHDLHKSRSQQVCIFYYLDDDTLAIQERSPYESKAIQYKFLERHRSFITPANIEVGCTVEIRGKKFYIIGCDAFTRGYLNRRGVRLSLMDDDLPCDWLTHIRNQEQIKKMTAFIKAQANQPRKNVNLKVDTGINVFSRGLLLKETNEFAQSYYDEKSNAVEELDLTQVKKEQDCAALVFSAVLANTRNAANRDRNFTIRFFLFDSCFQILEHFANRDEIFLERSRVQKPLVDPRPRLPCPESYKPSDLFIGNILEIKACHFCLTSAEVGTLHLMEQHPTLFPQSDLDRILTKVSEAFGNPNQRASDIFLAFLAHDPQNRGVMGKRDFRHVILTKASLTDHEVITVSRGFPVPQALDCVAYREFIDDAFGRLRYSNSRTFR